MHAGAARQAFLAKAETPATSDVEDALSAKTEEYIALLLGLVNSLPKAQQQTHELDEADLNGDTEASHDPVSVTEGL